MKLYIAGGCGEHGRNCFLVQTSTIQFLVDCGLMADEVGGGYPRLDKEIIPQIDYIFLTHSHLDHTGAYPWLVKNGFKGKLIATKETLNQLSFKFNDYLYLEDLKQLGNLKICYGKSGHCLGSVWYQFENEGKTILFSGDYSENTLVYSFDEIINRTADLAVIDCAYGKDIRPYEMYCELFVQEVDMLNKQYNQILLPVPKYGRGLELYALLKEKLPHLNYAADLHFINQVKRSLSSDCRKILDTNVELYKQDCRADIVFVSNPQLKTEESKKIAKEVIKHGFALMTGTVESGTYSANLIQKNKMKVIRYPVHLNEKQYLEILDKNNFKRAIAYHCPFIDTDHIIEF